MPKKSSNEKQTADTKMTLADGSSLDILGQNIEQMRAMFPEVFTEGSEPDGPRWKVDLEALGELLGQYVEDKPERYSFNWHGKARAKRIAQTPSTGTLRPCPEESVNWDTTQNIFIEGDNLEVLKLLQKSYHKKIKMIYIDPPYNTGKEFIYPDKFQENLNTYLRYTGQIDDEGLKISANSETGGRYHTNWLNMMYPRLKLARNLLGDNGMVFISIDDGEVANLRKLCDEIFGEENFLAQFVWKCRQFTDSRSKRQISTDHEYLLAYGKSDVVAFRGQPRDESKYKNPDNDPRGDWMSRSMLGLATSDQRPNLHYTISNPANGNVFAPPETTGWRYSQERMKNMIEEGRVLFPSTPKGRPREKKFRADLESQFTSFPTVIDDVHTSHGTATIRAIFDDAQIFDFPKPIELIQKFIEQTVGDDEMCMDLFAGSGATAHAVLRQNELDGLNRRFVMVQLPEPVDRKSQAAKFGMKTIADLGRERIRKVIKKDYASAGMKSFRLDTSNVNRWDVETGSADALFNAIESIKSNRSSLDLLIELLLKYGLDIGVASVERKVENETVFIVGHGALTVCLADEITLELVEGIADLRDELQPELMRVVFKDSGFADDVVKTNAIQILRQRGIDDVKTL